MSGPGRSAAVVKMRENANSSWRELVPSPFCGEYDGRDKAGSNHYTEAKGVEIWMDCLGIFPGSVVYGVSIQQKRTSSLATSNASLVRSHTDSLSPKPSLL